MFAGFWQKKKSERTTGTQLTQNLEVKIASKKKSAVDAKSVMARPTEKNGAPVEMKVRQEFENWGRTVKNTPLYTFYPKTIAGVENIVKFAKANGKRVRVSAFQHTWAPMFGEDNEILIAILPYKEANSLPVSYPTLNNQDELRHITPVGEEFKDTDGKMKHLFRIGPAVTNQQMRVWANAAFNAGKPAYCYPVAVIMEETTLSGMVSNGCHGSGLLNQTISDNVEEIVVVNAKGERQTFRRGDPEFPSVAVDFGRFGVKVELIMKLERMPHARMHPQKTRLALAVPPPLDYKIANVIPQAIMANLSTAQLAAATKNLHNRFTQSAYEEEFLFAGQHDVWTNAWTEDGDPAESIEYPSACLRKFQGIEEYVAGLANDSLMRLLPASTQTELLSAFAMLTLPTGPVTTTKVNAMHFRGGVQNMRVQDMEFEIEIPENKDGSLDWSIVQRAWWDAIEIYYRFAVRQQFPMRLPLELRVMGGSQMTLSAQRGNKATCSIEVLTIREGLVDRALWLQFMQAVTDKWASYTDQLGRPLRVIPHLAKQWEGLTIQRPGEKRLEMEVYLREVAFKDAIPVFNQHLAAAAEKGGYTLQETDIFLNPFLERFLHGKKIEKKSGASPVERKPCSSPLPAGVFCAATAEKYMRSRLEKAKEEIKLANSPVLKTRRSGDSPGKQFADSKDPQLNPVTTLPTDVPKLADKPEKLWSFQHRGVGSGEFRSVTLWGDAKDAAALQKSLDMDVPHSQAARSPTNRN